MPGIATEDRDWDAVRTGLRAWLSSRRPHASGLDIGPLSSNPSNGFSADSVFVDVRWDHSGSPVDERLVLRLPPAGGGLWPEYDLGVQSRVQEVVGRHGIPVARQVGYEEDETWIGSPFVVMMCVSGRVPSDDPPYCVDGWLYDQNGEDQARLYENALDVIASVNRLDWCDAGLGFVAGRRQGVGLAAELAWWDRYVAWAADGSPSVEVADAMRWCHEHRPDPEPPPALAWGDARLGNMMFGPAQDVTAVLDWEMVSIGPAELDLGWFLAYQRRMRCINGNQPDPELPGFLDHDRAVAHFERSLGRAVSELDWYEVFCMVRLGACITRVQGLLRAQGITDHFVLTRPLFQPWVHALMDAY